MLRSIAVRSRKLINSRQKEPKIIDDPEILGVLPESLTKIIPKIENLKPYPASNSAYVSWFEFKKSIESGEQFNILPLASSEYNYLEYTADRKFELSNLPKLPITNNPSAKKMQESCLDHMNLEFKLEDHVNTPQIKRYMDAVLEGLRSNPYLSLSQKKKRLEFYKNFFSKISLNPCSDKKKTTDST